MLFTGQFRIKIHPVEIKWRGVQIWANGALTNILYHIFMISCITRGNVFIVCSSNNLVTDTNTST